MAADVAEYPIVVLENDAPEQVGKVGLFDLRMPVGDTGIVFIAAVPGILYTSGPQFTEPVQRAADLRASTTLIHMGLVRGESLAFIRQGLRLSQQEVADLCGVTSPDVVGWENNTMVVPLTVWNAISQRACIADGRSLPLHHALCADWRPRVIRVFPNIPSQGVPQPHIQAPPYPQGPAIPGSECYPPPRC